jgi:hypothetical protein
MPDLSVATLLLASGTAAAAVIGLIRYRVVFLSEPSHGPNGQVVHNLYLGIERRQGRRRRAGAVTGGPTDAESDRSAGPRDGAAAGRTGDGPEEGGGLHFYVVWKR